MFSLYKPKTSKNAPANIQQKNEQKEIFENYEKTEKFSKTIEKTHHKIVFFFFFFFIFYFYLVFHFLELISS